MNEYFIAIATAAWLGFLTSISPCPLATNIAAISFVSRNCNAARWWHYRGAGTFTRSTKIYEFADGPVTNFGSDGATQPVEHKDYFHRGRW